MLRQEIDPRASRTVREEASTALAELDRLEAEMAELEAEMSRHGVDGVALPASLTERYDAVGHRYRLAGGFERDARVSAVLAGSASMTNAQPVRSRASAAAG